MYGSVCEGLPARTSKGRQPPYAPIATYSVIFGVETKSPGAARQNLWPIAFAKYLCDGRLMVAFAISASSSAKLTWRYDPHARRSAMMPLMQRPAFDPADGLVGRIVETFLPWRWPTCSWRKVL